MNTHGRARGAHHVIDSDPDEDEGKNTRKCGEGNAFCGGCIHDGSGNNGARVSIGERVVGEKRIRASRGMCNVYSVKYNKQTRRKSPTGMGRGPENRQARSRVFDEKNERGDKTYQRLPAPKHFVFNRQTLMTIDRNVTALYPYVYS